MQEEQLRNLSLIFAVLGLIVSVYLTYLHYTSSMPACPETGIINCENVLTSQYSVILGIPVPVLGVLFFLAELAVILVLKSNDLFIILSGIGLAFVAFFIYAEYRVGNICLYCTATHICTLALFIIAVLKDRKK